MLTLARSCRSSRRRRSLAACVACLSLMACTQPRRAAAPAGDTTEVARVDAQLARYAAAVRRMDTAQVAELFAADGEVENGGEVPIRGPAAIKSFLDTFSDYRVLSHTNIARNTNINGDHATQTGDFDQTVIIPQGGTVHVSGTFVATWTRQADGGWLLLRMQTQPHRPSE